ncbi:transporter [Desulfocurvus sp. DL9XJH121]
MKKHCIAWGLFLALICLSRPALAQGPVMGGSAQEAGQVTSLPDTKVPKPVGPVNMSTGMVFKPGKAAVCLKALFMDKDTLYDGNDEKEGKYNGKYDRTQRTYQASFRYGVVKDFDMRVMVPYRSSSVQRRSAVGKPAEATKETTNMGLGDVVLMGRYALWDQRDGDPLSVAVGAGVKMPTGDPDKKNPAPFNKSFEYMGPGFQLGTGSWDPKLELGLTRMMGRHRLDAHTMYTFGREGDHGLRLGDQFKYDLGYSFALTNLLDLELELNGVNQNRNKNDDRYVANSGGNMLFLTPGVHFKFTERFNAGFALPIVVYRDLNADAQEDQYCVGEDYRLVFKLAYKLN